jgi:hypothetical protein
MTITIFVILEMLFCCFSGVPQEKTGHSLCTTALGRRMVETLSQESSLFCTSQAQPLL